MKNSKLNLSDLDVKPKKILSGTERLRQKQTDQRKVVRAKYLLPEQKATRASQIDFEKGLEDDIENLYREEENCAKVETA